MNQHELLTGLASSASLLVVVVRTYFQMRSDGCWMCWYHFTTCNDPVFRNWSSYQVGRQYSTSSLCEEGHHILIILFPTCSKHLFAMERFLKSFNVISVCASRARVPLLLSSFKSLLGKNWAVCCYSRKTKKMRQKKREGYFSKRGCKWSADTTHWYRENAEPSVSLLTLEGVKKGTLALRNGTQNKRVTKESEHLGKCWTGAGLKQRDCDAPRWSFAEALGSSAEREVWPAERTSG